MKSMFLAAVACIALMGCAEEELSTIKSFNVLPEEAGAGEEVTVSFAIRGTEKVKEVKVLSPVHGKVIECGNAEDCGKSVKLRFPSPGAYKVELNVLLEGGKKLEKSKVVYVVDKRKKCTDGTPEGECSAIKPNYCENGELVERCGECGCMAGACLGGGECSEELSEIRIERIFPDRELVGKGKKFTVNLSVANTGIETIFAGEKFGLKLEFGCGEEKKVYEKEFAFPEKILPLEQTETGIEVEEGLKEKCAYSLSAALTKNGKIMDDVREENFIRVDSDSIAPAAPIGVNARAINGAVKLSWLKNPENDLWKYAVYKSTQVLPTHIPYALYAEVEGKTETMVKGLEKGKHYFTLKAVDAFGNESGYSEAVSVVVE